MTRIPSRNNKRSAFTLIELMVVILIIAILASLLASAIVKVLGKLPEVKTRTEITQLEVGLRGFMDDYQLSDPPPSSLLLYEDVTQYTLNPAINISNNALAARSFSFLKRVFGKNIGSQGVIDWNGDALPDGPNGTTTTPWILEGEHCLIFYIGGIPNTAAVLGGAAPGPQGFSTNNMNPSTALGRRRGPYYNFEVPRLIPSASPNNRGFFTYLDPWQVKTGPMPYVYFSSYGINNGYSLADCASVTFTDLVGTHSALPYWTAQSAATPPVPTQFTYSNTYQIISAGKDGKFGYNASFLPAVNNLWVPSSGAMGYGADDQANFSSTVLGTGQN